MPVKLQQLEHVVLSLIENGVRNAMVSPLNLGGINGPGGGDGGPPGGFIGRLKQTRVAYDESELETLDTPASGQSLLDNLNHIRYRIATLEDGPPPLTVNEWDGSPNITNVDEITFSGAVVVTQLESGHALVTITASGGSPFNGDPDSVLVTDSVGDIDTVPWLVIDPTNEAVEFGADVVGKESNAGKIGYESFGAGFLYIIGAGTSSTNRWVKIFDNLNVDLAIQSTSMNIATGNTYNINGSPHAHFNDGEGDPADVASASADGTSAYSARRDHVHKGALKPVFILATNGAGGTIAAGITEFLCPYYDDLLPAERSVFITRAGTVKNLYFRKSGTQPATGTLVVTVRKNSTNQSLTITVPAGNVGNNTFSDTSNSFTVASGDQVSVGLVNNASTASCGVGGVAIDVEYDP